MPDKLSKILCTSADEDIIYSELQNVMAEPSHIDYIPDITQLKRLRKMTSEKDFLRFLLWLDDPERDTSYKEGHKEEWKKLREYINETVDFV